MAASVCGTSATAKPRVVEVGDGEARAVDGDRALLDHVAEELGRRVEPDARPVDVVGLDAAHRPDRVDVALDVVAAERLAGTQRGLDVDARPGRKTPERGARERLGHDVERDPAVRDRDGGEAARR